MIGAATLSEQIGPWAVAAGAVFLIMAIIAILFLTNFPSTGRIRSMPGYRVAAGAFFTFGAIAALAFIFSFVVLVLNLSTI